MMLEEIRRRAEAALSKPAPHGPDLRIEDFPLPRGRRGAEDLQSLSRLGIDPSQASYVQVDERPVEVRPAAPGVRVHSLSEALEEGLVEGYFWRAIDVDTDKYTAAAELFGGHEGYVIIAERGAKVEQPVLACLLLSTPGALQAPHNIVIVEEGAELHVVTGCLTSIEAPGLHAGISEFYVKEGGRLTFTMIHQWAESTHVRPRTAVIVERGGEYVSHYVNMSPIASIQTDPKVYLVGEGARAYLSSVIVAPKESRMDVGGSVFLRARGTSAEIVSKTITKDRADVVTRALISAEAGGTRGHIECDGLLLSEGSRIVTLPALDARVDDVQLSHEAAVGRLSEEQLYYLMTKGFSEEEAKSILVRGFMDVRLEGLPKPVMAQIRMALELAARGL
ncbi:MAG: SufD family Fe-S cluster assembly protein [Candidatus Korarchaeota archaeon NZ13-K]|nr:MAG: SufD family Fe-S cluster assembly protein [Candidatus Korarchaeota archaeon NZ13-K]